MRQFINAHFLIPVLAAVVHAGAAQVASPPAGQLVSPPRLRTTELPTQTPEAFGGGEVVLDLAIDVGGAVSAVNPLRVTPPFTDAVVKATSSWRFTPAVALVEKSPTVVAGRVLVVAMFRPATVYAGPAPGTVPQVLGIAPPSLPDPVSLTMPAYPPNVVGDRLVLVEIEMTVRDDSRNYRVMSPASGFDAAALDAVRSWRFKPPTADVPERLFVYALIGFRTPVAKDA